MKGLQRHVEIDEPEEDDKIKRTNCTSLLLVL